MSSKSSEQRQLRKKSSQLRKKSSQPFLQSLEPRESCPRSFSCPPEAARRLWGERMTTGRSPGSALPPPEAESLRSSHPGTHTRDPSPRATSPMPRRSLNLPTHHGGGPARQPPI